MESAYILLEFSRSRLPGEKPRSWLLSPDFPIQICGGVEGQFRWRTEGCLSHVGLMTMEQPESAPLEKEVPPLLFIFYGPPRFETENMSCSLPNWLGLWVWGCALDGIR